MYKYNFTIPQKRSHSFVKKDRYLYTIYSSSSTVGTIVLEDWDEDGKVLLLRNYPSIHDGVTIQFHLITKYSYIHV